MNPLNNIANRELIGIDFSADSLRLAHVRISPNKWEVLNLLSHDTSGLSNDQISDIIRTSFNELKPKNPHIANIIPPHLVITKNIEIPSTKPQEIKEIIDLQAGRHTPYSREEITVDYIIVGTYRHSYTKILLIIVARNIIKRQFEILRQAGIRLEKVALMSEGLAFFIPKILKLGTENNPIGIFHVDESFSNFTVVFKNRPVFIRSIPLGGQHIIGEGEERRLKFVDEIKKSLEAYNSEDVEKSPNILILTGVLQGLKDFEAVLGENLHLPIKAISYLEPLSVSDKAMKAAAAARSLSFLNVLAPLFAWRELKVDLIPEEIKLGKLLEERGKNLIKTGIFILTIFVLTFSAFASNIYFKIIYLKQLDDKYKSLNQETQKLESSFTRVSLIKYYLSTRGYALEVLTELHEIAPLDLKLSDIQFDMQGKFSVKGTAESMSTVFSFVDNMEKSKYFKDVKTRYTTKRKDGLRDVTDFEIVMELNK